jgi:hypothetical protein
VRRGLRRRHGAEMPASIASSLLFLLTLARPDSIEAIFEVEPDGGSGELECVLVAVLLATTLALSALAWRERRRAASYAGQQG